MVVINRFAVKAHQAIRFDTGGPNNLRVIIYTIAHKLQIFENTEE